MKTKWLRKARIIINSLWARWCYLIFRLKGNRLVIISYPHRIGHLCQEVDGLLRDWIRGGLNTKKLYINDIGSEFANQHLVNYYRNYLNVAPLAPILSYIERFGDKHNVIIETHPYELAMYKTAKIYESFAQWGDRPVLMKLSAEDEVVGAKALSDFGLDESSWFVCLHAREGGYSRSDDQYHSFRNVDINSFDLAVEEITRRGGWVIRMGDSTMRPMTPNPKVVDYARHPNKSPKLDVILSAKCRFFLGTASGLYNVAEMFGRPCAVTNMTPISASFAPSPMDLSIFQRVATKDGRPIGFEEAFNNELSNFRFTHEFDNANIINIKNTATEIYELVVEMLDRLDGVAVYREDDFARQILFKSYFREGHYAYKSASNIGRDFLRRHLSLPAGRDEQF